jgi:Response regulator containing CheY-like receiver, AAA-type ATPase, and DNA-binding domains
MIISEKQIIVVDAEKDHCREIAQMIQAGGYQVVTLHSFHYLERYLQGHDCLIAILDLSALSVDNRIVKELALKHHGTYFLGLTEHRFNPELEEAICHYIYACIAKPVDPEELLYWIRSISLDNKPQETSGTNESS